MKSYVVIYNHSNWKRYRQRFRKYTFQGKGEIIMKKKLISALLSVAMVSALLAGCGSKAEPESTPAPADTQAEAGSEAEPSEPAESVAETPAALQTEFRPIRMILE